MTSSDISEQQLQAFVDDEIDTRERAEIMEAIRKDEALACRVCELLQLKDSVRLAYREPPPNRDTSSRRLASRKAKYSIQAVAAVCLLLAGAMVGWILNPQLTGNPTTTMANLIQMDPAMNELKRVVLHVSTADADRMEQALDDVELLLANYQDNLELVQLEVVANDEGLELLRMDTSPHAERIQHLWSEYINLDFLACGRAIEKLRLKGIDVQLLPEADVIPSALEQISDHLQDGWIYIRV